MRVYVAGPLDDGGEIAASERGANLSRAIGLADFLFGAGHSPYLPHLRVVWNNFYGRSDETWLKLGLEWLGYAECLVRLPGESSGADREEAEARRLGIPVIKAAPEKTLLARLATVEKSLGPAMPAKVERKRPEDARVWARVKNREVENS